MGWFWRLRLRLRLRPTLRFPAGVAPRIRGLAAVGLIALIAQDAQPVLVLRSVDGVLMSVNQLRTLVRERAVRYAIIPNPCSGKRHCTPTTAWTVRNSVMVRKGLYRYMGPSRLR